MKLYGSLESLVAYSIKVAVVSSNVKGVLPSVENNSEESSIDTLLLDKVRNLGAILSHVEKDMAQRKALSENIVSKIDYQYCYVRSALFRTYMFGTTNSSGYSLRSKLEQQIFSLVQEVRSEKQNCWQDIAKLKQEFRIWLKQYLDMLQRVKIILPDIERTKLLKNNG